MGEARRRELIQQQIQVNVDGQDPVACECGCIYWQTMFKQYIVSALLSPTGKEIAASQAVLLCKDCGKEWKAKT